jgi:hypothetical protein
VNCSFSNAKEMTSVLRKRLSQEQGNGAGNPKSISENKFTGDSDALVGDSLLALYKNLNRKMTERKFNRLFTECLNLSQNEPQLIADLFVLAFQTRDCRGCGKGERLLFYEFVRCLNRIYPQTLHSLLPLIKEYGYFQDYFNLLQSDEPPLLPSAAATDMNHAKLEANDSRNGLGEDNQQPPLLSDAKDRKWTPFLKIQKSSHLSQHAEDIALQNEIVIFLVRQLREDERKVDEFLQSTSNLTRPSISYCAKYAPREGKSFAKQKKRSYYQLLSALFPSELEQSQQKKKYRQLISKLAGYLNIPETSMCTHQFSSIDFNRVPSLCLKKYRKALLNEKLNDSPATNEVTSTGNRFPNDTDRVNCRKHLLDALYSPDGCRLKGKLFPHEIIKEWVNEASNPRQRRKLSPVENELIQAQWNDMKKNLLKNVKKEPIESSSASFDSSFSLNLGKLVPLVDVSGSMTGVPLNVAVSLGILISEVNHPAFRNRILTFETTPSWIDLSACSQLRDKVQKVVEIVGGNSTNIETAMDPIEATIVEQNLGAEDIPDLIILTDMWFDEACNDLTSFPIWNIFSGVWSLLTGSSAKESLEFQLTRIQKRFHDLGIRLSGTPFPAPKIIFWNLRTVKSVIIPPTQHENVQMLCGFSPSLFVRLLDGTYDKSEDEGRNELLDVAPYPALRKLLDSERYFPIRKILSETQEGGLLNYYFSSDTASFTSEKKRKCSAGYES